MTDPRDSASSRTSSFSSSRSSGSFSMSSGRNMPFRTTTRLNADDFPCCFPEEPNASESSSECHASLLGIVSAYQGQLAYSSRVLIRLDILCFSSALSFFFSVGCDEVSGRPSDFLP